MENNSLNIYLTIDGTSTENEEVTITNPNKPLGELINRIINTFHLPETNNKGTTFSYVIWRNKKESNEPEIMALYDENGQENNLFDYNVQQWDHLHVISLPIKGSCPSTSNPTFQTEVFEESFFIYLTVEGTSIENVKLVVTDPMKTIREQRDFIVKVFNLPKMDNGGNPITYLIGRIEDDSYEPYILEFDDADGREQTLIDYNVQSGDHLHLISRAIAGGCLVSFVPSPKRSSWRSLIDGIISKKQEVYSSIFAPTYVQQHSHMIVQVYLHLFKEAEIVKALAQESQQNAERRDYIPLQCKLKKGDKVDVLLNIYGETLLMSEKKSLVWQGSFTKCSFDYYVPQKTDINELSCVAMLSIDGAIVGEMRFSTIVSEYAMRFINTEVYAHQYNKIFISYAHQDEAKVKPMARAYQAQGVDYFFDRHYLKPGDIFPLKIKEFIDNADLFILCWSANAAKSDYMELERKQALKRAFPQVRPIEKAKLSIYPMSIEPQAELPLDMKDIYNFEVI